MQPIIWMVFCWFLKGTEIWIHIKSIEQNLFLLCLFLHIIVSGIIGKKCFELKRGKEKDKRQPIMKTVWINIGIYEAAYSYTEPKKVILLFTIVRPTGAAPIWIVDWSDVSRFPTTAGTPFLWINSIIAWPKATRNSGSSFFSAGCWNQRKTRLKSLFRL